MTDSLDNVDIEITIKVMQQNGWSQENVLAETKRQSKGTITLDSVASLVRDMADECVAATTRQFTITRDIKTLEKQLLLEKKDD